jgi:hypothetical protein
MNDAYSILGVSPSATPADIRRAYRRLALLNHPDKLPPTSTADERAASEERFKLIANAYEVLIDPEKRAKYDAGGHASTSAWGTAHHRSSRDTFRAFFGAWDDDEADIACGGGVDVEERTAEDVINLPLFEGYLVLDARSVHERANTAESVASAVPCAAEEIAAVGWNGWFSASNDDFSHDHHSPVVILGGDIALAHSLASFIASCAGSDTSTLPSSLRRLSVHCRRIWFIRGGPVAVLSCFPCLLSSLQQNPTPHIIAPGLLLGSRAVPWRDEHLSVGLLVTHVVVARSDQSVAAPLPSLNRLDLDLSDDTFDEHDEKLFAAWDAALDFIESAIKTGGRVMVRVHGRSRSASVALAWMVRANALPVAMAARLLRAQSPNIDWNLA